MTILSTDHGRILLIGSGRLAKHLAYWQQHQTNSRQIQLLQWDRSQSTDTLSNYLQLKPLVWLAITDSSIASFYDKHLAGHNLRIVHFSGALHHPGILSAHPLMSFPEKLFETKFYSNIHFVINGFQTLEEALPGFKNSFSVISEKDKAFYHALCVVAGNFPQILWNEVFREATDIKIPAAAFETYIQKVTENFIEQKSAALTGPLIRKDSSTIESNIASLQRNKFLQSIYMTFAKGYGK